MNNTVTAKPWYREPWPWILMAGPATVVVAAFVTAGLAVHTNDSLVVDDYYKEGLAINKVIHRDQAASAMGLSADVMRNGRSVRVMVSSGGAQMDQAEKLQLTLTHATRPEFDQNIVLQKEGAGFYSGSLTAEPAGGRYRAVLQDGTGTWRLVGDWKAGSEDPLKLVAVK
jgi:uncharacterized protein